MVAMKSTITVTYVVFSLLLLCLGGALAVKYGHEHFSDAEEGMIVTFGTGYVSFVDPETKAVIKTLSETADGTPLVGPDGNGISWADAVYMECPPLDGTERVRPYVFVNERDVWSPESESGLPSDDADAFADESFSYVSVIDTDAMEIIARVKVGPGPVHSYAVPWLQEFWTHPDARGEFDVISCANVTAVSAERITANVGEAGHGKLLADFTLGSRAYATNTNEAFIYELNLETKELVEAHPITDAAGCRGTHAIDYSDINGHLYIECVGGGGLVEFDANTNTVINQWPEETGALYESPDGGFIVTSNKVGSKFHVFQPQRSGNLSTKAFDDILVPNPGSPQFVPNGEVTDEEGLTFTDYVVFVPLINNPSANFIECEYGPDGRTLALDADGQVLTPNCGSCNPDPQYDGKLSGFAFFDLFELEQATLTGETLDPTLIQAGGVQPTGPYVYSPECGYGRTYRSGVRGGQWVAAGADYDFEGNPALAIIDTQARALHGFVSLPSKPYVLAWVPSEKGLQPDYAGGDGANDE